MQSRVPLTGVIVAIALFAMRSASAGTLSVAVAPEQITISSASPNGSIMLVGFDRARTRSAYRSKTYSITVTASADGGALWKPPSPVGPDSAWLAIDVASGRYALASAERERPLAKGRIRKDKSGRLQTIEPHLPFATVMVFRRSGDSWEITAGDGGASDRDRLVDGKIELALDDFTPLGRTSGRAESIEQDDLVVIIDRERGLFLTQRGGGQ